MDTVVPTIQIIPRHVAVVMDGNRRWARSHGLPVIAGHSHVVNAVLEPLISYAADLGISYMTFWAFSTENWNRQEDEVGGIMHLLRISLRKFGEKMHKKGCRILAIGDISHFSADIRDTISYLEHLTADNSKITTIFALNYGGRDEIIRAIRKVSSIMYQVSGDNVTPDALTPDTFSNYLDTAGIPDPDLVVRTGGEQRLSGFLLWQSQYSELYFPEWYMPEFSPSKLDEVLDEYRRRQRRFGV